MQKKIIHQMTGDHKPDLVLACMLSWQILKKSGFEIRVWDDRIITSFLKKQYPTVLPAFLNARNHAEAADIARYIIVYHFGGCYIDWDIQLLDDTGFLALMEDCPNGHLVIDPANGTLASECFSANPGEPYLLSLTGDILELYQRKQRDALFTPQYSGPYRMRDALQKHGNSTQRLIPVKDIFAYDYSEIRTKPDREIVQPLLHYWMHSWIR
ncbi:glycosyltransferase family 32 protein [Chitinophaga rhizosphaerae]|uniref:glycosyltransferase family 32 protein n=1 Tax=Chitinophaga rhizosphaerae TaxID=1864947 RepID=UPI000F8068A8|nr:glycosyltransferase [Chitinophaga rhizosphaerae]